MKKINCIMLIDDNPADNEFHTIAIKEADVCNIVKVVTNGKQALEYLKKSHDPGQGEEFPSPNLIYLDVNMPGMSGFEFLEEYQKLNEKLKSSIIIVMLTVSLNPDDREKAIGLKEVAQFENKPLTAEVVRTTVGKYF